jgi:glycosyltransferase involved in cell wall biosynthesis
MMLYTLLARIDRTRFAPEVVSLIEFGSMGEKIQALGIPVRSLGMRPGIPSPMAVFRLAQWLRQDPPDILQTWMYHANLLGGLAAKLAGTVQVVWGIHQGTLSPEGNKQLTVQTVKTCARMSSWLPARIVCCSETSWQVHAALGYSASKMVVIPNGFDLENFRPDSVARESVRKELQVPEEALVIGLVGRFHSQKDHRSFVRAAALLHKDRPDVYFVLCGGGITWENVELTRWIEEAGIRDRCRLLGRREDMARLTVALDLASSSSCYGEAFPMVLGEAMACGVPCVVTDVGDSALIVGDTGRVVPPKNPMALALAWRELIEMGQETRVSMGMAARHRIKKHFELSDIVAKYENLYSNVVSGRSV